MLALAHALKSYGRSSAGGGPAWSPADLGSSKLRLWLRPEGPKYQDLARTTPASAGDPCGSWTDESGNSKHAGQGASGNRPTVRANGGLTLGGSHWLTTLPLGAWTGDFAVLVVARTTTFSNYSRYASVAFDTSWNLMNGASSGDIVSGVVAPNPPYGDIVTTAAINAIHSFFDRRVGTTHRLSIDGAADITASVTGSAITDGVFYIGSDGGFHMVGDAQEIVVVAGGSAGDLANLAGYAASRMSSGVFT